ncbi:MAG: hypothetical protein ACLFR7_08755, partial [Opitutales bacterium]
MKSLRLASRIGLGFASVILLMLLLGGFAFTSMKEASARSESLADIQLPELTLTQSAQQRVLRAMDSNRAYGLTAIDAYRASGAENLEEAVTTLEETLELAHTYDLPVLQRETEKALGIIETYFSQLEETTALNTQIERDRTMMTAAANDFMAATDAYLESQETAYAREIADSSGSDEATLRERMQKVGLINDILDVGNSVRVLNWRAQADRDLAVLDQATEEFRRIEGLIEQLRPITREPADITRLQSTEKAATSYQAAINSLRQHWADRDRLGTERGKTGDAIL